MSENAVGSGPDIEPEILRKEIDELKADIRRDLGEQSGLQTGDETFEQEEEPAELDFDYDPGYSSDEETRDTSQDGLLENSEGPETNGAEDGAEDGGDLAKASAENSETQAVEQEPLDALSEEEKDELETPFSVEHEPLDESIDDETNESLGEQTEDQKQEHESLASDDSLIDLESVSEYLSIPVLVEYNGTTPLYDPKASKSILSEPATPDFSLDSVFTAMREHFDTSTGSEIILHIPQLDLEVGEDNLYCNDTTLLDLLRLLDTCDDARNLQLSVELRPRFISKLNALFDKLNDLPPTKKSRLA